MHSILDRIWVIREVSPSSRFKEQERVEITTKAEVIVGGELWQGVYDETRNTVTVQPSDSERWELVGSGQVGSQFTLFGFSWGADTTPDALGTWVADPQGTP